MDIKKLGRIPDGGGWRKLGRGNDKTKGHSGVGYAYLHHVVDDCSRLAYSEILGDEKKDTVAGFWNRARDFFTGYGIDISRVMTDNGPAYRSRLFNNVLAAQQAKHVFTRPYRPQTNGKIERFHRTLADGWAYARHYVSEQERREALGRWLHDYNHHRPRSACGGLPPVSRLTNLPGQYT